MNDNKQNILGFLLFLIVICYSVSLQAAQSATYELIASMDPEPHLKVRLSLDGYGDSVKWLLPRHLGKWNDLYKNVQGLRCYDAHNNELQVAYDNKYTISIEPADNVVCNYIVTSDCKKFTSSTRYKPVFRRRYFYFFGEHFVISPMDASKLEDNVTVIVNLPRGWRSFSTWSEIGRPKRYKGWSGLKNATFNLGDYRLKSRKVNGKKLHVVLRGKWALSDRAIVKRVKNIVQSINDLWTDRVSDEYFVFVSQYDKGTSDGWYSGTMRDNAIAIEIPPSASFNDIFNGLIAHEYFHNWNGGIIEVGCKNGIDCYWFQEGATSYFTDIIVSNQSSDSMNVFLEYLGSKIGAYSNNTMKGMTHSKIRDCFWKDSACYNYVYDRGYLLSWILDCELRKRSSGKKSLFGYLKYLLSMAGKGKYIYDNNKLLNSINAYSGADYSLFWKKHIRGSEELPVMEYLNECGVEMKPARNVRPDYGFKLNILAGENRATVDIVDIGGAAWKAGLRPDDQLTRYSVYWGEFGKKAKLFISQDDGSSKKISFYPIKREDIEYRCELKPRGRDIGVKISDMLSLKDEK